MHQLYQINQNQLNIINVIIKTLNVAIQRQTFSDEELDKIFSHLNKLNSLNIPLN
jgi:hypothetical protein